MSFSLDEKSSTKLSSKRHLITVSHIFEFVVRGTTLVSSIAIIRLRVLLHLSYDKFFMYTDWLQDRGFLETRELLYPAAN